MVVRSELPQNYLLKPDIVLEDFSNVTDWVKSGDVDGSMESDTEYVETGTSSIKVTGTTATGTTITKMINPVNLLGKSLIGLLCYIEDTTGYGTLKVVISSYTSGKSFYKNIAFDAGGWRLIILNQNEFFNDGGDDWKRNIIRIRINVACASGSPQTVILDSLVYGRESFAQCTISFDDALSSTYSTAFPIMQQYGLVGTAYIPTDFIDSAPYYLTEEQVYELYDAGWTIGNHTAHHTALTDYATVEEVEESLGTAMDWLNDHGFEDGAKIVSYPGSAVNSNVLEAMKNLKMKMGRYATNLPQTTPIQDFFLTSGYRVQNADLSPSILGWLDSCRNEFSTFRVGFHGVVASPSLTTDCSTSKFTTLVQNISARNIVVKNEYEWYAGLNNPRYRSI